MPDVKGSSDRLKILISSVYRVRSGGCSLADVIFETKDLKVFLDFMDNKDATYHMNFQLTTFLSSVLLMMDVMLEN